MRCHCRAFLKSLVYRLGLCIIVSIPIRVFDWIFSNPILPDRNFQTTSQPDKRLFTFVETDGCFADGLSVATGCWLGRRTMRLMDYGKTAATFIDTKTDRAIRIWTHPNCRTLASHYVSDGQSRWHTMLEAYQLMPADELLCWRKVELTVSLKEIISRAGVRVNCEICGEEIINEREVLSDGLTVCRSCAGDSYYSFESMDVMDYFKDGCC